MLHAITHKYCVDPPDASCDVCGMLFFPTWAFFIPGNFWTGRCSYVNKLLHPLEFESKKEHVSAYWDQLSAEKLMTNHLWEDRDDTRGLKRYSAGMSTKTLAPSSPCLKKRRL